MQVGSIVFGPRQTPEEAARRRSELTGLQSLSIQMVPAMMCNCMGPQPGETKCPCMLRAELKQAQEMIENGIVIAGRKYRLVPDSD